MRYIAVTDGQPDWRPLERFLRAATRPGSSFGLDPSEFMYMVRVVAPGRPDVHLYKHIDTRRYLNLDDAGHAYAFVGSASDTGAAELAGHYRPLRDIRAAVDRLGLDTIELEC